MNACSRILNEIELLTLTVLFAVSDGTVACLVPLAPAKSVFSFLSLSGHGNKRQSTS